MEKHGKLKPAKIKIQRTVNVGIVFKFIQQYVKLVGVGPQDIVEGNPKVVLGLIWTIFSTFALRKCLLAVVVAVAGAVAGAVAVAVVVAVAGAVAVAVVVAVAQL